MSAIAKPDVKSRRSNRSQQEFADPDIPGGYRRDGRPPTYLSNWASIRAVRKLVAQGRYDELRPVCAEFVPTLQCPYRCSHCHFKAVKQQLKAWDSEDRSAPGTEMTVREACHALDSLRDGGVQALQFTGGGEPLAHPKIREIVDYAKSRGFQLSVNTNGTFIGNLVPEALVEEYGFHQVRVSLDAAGSLHATMHGYDPSQRDYFEDVRSNVRRMRRSKDRSSAGTILTCCVVFNEINYRQLALLGEEIAALGFDRVTVRPVQNYFGGQNQLSPRAVAEAVDLIETRLRPTLEKEGITLIVPEHRFRSLANSGRSYTLCRAAPLIAGIWPNGAYLCTETSGLDRFRIGDLQQQSLEEIYRSSRFREVIDRVATDRCRSCPISCRPHFLNQLFDDIEKLRSMNPGLLQVWIRDLADQHAQPNPWIGM